MANKASANYTHYTMKPELYPKNPSHLWEHFYALTQIPRPSKYEEGVRQYIENLAKKNGHEFKVDEAGNIVVYLPGTKGREKFAPVIIQNHMDMVTDASLGHNINFRTDPIKLQSDGEFVKAIETTLGADNGIGCAAALSLMTDKTLEHPPLELLFTTDEETGLHGALNLDPQLVSARRMLNLDTEEWGSLYIGCAGGIDYELTGQLQRTELLHDALFKIEVGGLVGGHSGIDIHRNRANAIKILAELLFEIKDLPFQICESRGGKAHNIIPRDAFVILNMSKSDSSMIEAKLKKKYQELKSVLPTEDQGMSLLFKEENVISFNDAYSEIDSKKLIQLMMLFPHGAHRYDLNTEDKVVSMSNNMARVLLVREKIYFQASLRFFDRNEVRTLENQLAILGEQFALTIQKNSEYPSWKPVPHNPMLDLVKDRYAKLFNQKAHVTAIHAGLECGILKDKIGDIDIVSFGPSIYGAHSPNERVEIKSVENFWILFKDILQSMQ